jgi:thiol-disulfide isomerase/thioredoxin
MKKSILFLLSIVLIGAGCGTASQEPISVQEDGAGRYQNYEEAALRFAQDGDVVIFFHASWCPTCKAQEEAILRDAQDIPSDLTILKADFDTEIALREKYEVTLQHTLIQVDADGGELARWNGGTTLNSIVSQLK